MVGNSYLPIDLLFCLLNSSVGFDEIIHGSVNNNSLVEKITHLKIPLFIPWGVIFYVSIKYTVKGVKHLIN